MCVIGGGVIGSLFAGHLARVTEVSVLTRRPDHAAALNEHGLRVSGRSDFTAEVTATSDPDELPEFDLGIVATKATGLEAAAGSLAGRFAGATVMPVPNGFGAEQTIRRRGDWPIVSAVTFMSGTRHGDAHRVHPRHGDLARAVRGDAVRTRRGGRRPDRSAGLKAKALPDLRPAQWSKLIFNATVNAVAALTGLPHDGHFAAEEEGPGPPRSRADRRRQTRRRGRGIELHEDRGR